MQLADNVRKMLSAGALDVEELCSMLHSALLPMSDPLDMRVWRVLAPLWPELCNGAAIMPADHDCLAGPVSGSTLLQCA